MLNRSYLADKYYHNGAEITAAEYERLMAEYKEKYVFATENVDAIRYQAREEIAMKKMLDAEGCMAFANTFQDLYGMEQLPGLASQHLMAQGYGYGGEGDCRRPDRRHHLHGGLHLSPRPGQHVLPGRAYARGLPERCRRRSAH